jgi:hypothetical protein
MSIRNAANAPLPQRTESRPAHLTPTLLPRVLQSHQPPAQLSFYFKRG